RATRKDLATPRWHVARSQSCREAFWTRPYLRQSHRERAQRRLTQLAGLRDKPRDSDRRELRQVEERRRRGLRDVSQRVEFVSREVGCRCVSCTTDRRGCEALVARAQLDDR